jgi:hypothetical protein
MYFGDVVLLISLLGGNKTQCPSKEHARAVITSLLYVLALSSYLFALESMACQSHEEHNPGFHKLATDIQSFEQCIIAKQPSRQHDH